MAEQTTEERIAEIAQGFGQGIQNYRQGQQQQQAQSLQAEALKRQKAMQAIEVSNSIATQTGKRVDPGQIGSMLDSGNIGGIQALMESAPTTRKFEAEQAQLKRQTDKDLRDQEKAQYESDQRAKPVTMRDDYIKAAGTAQIRANNQESMFRQRQEGEAQKKFNEAKIQDFDLIDPTILPSSKDAEEIKKLSASNKSFQEIGARASENLKKANPRDPRYFISNDWKLLNQDLTKMKLQAKNLEDLGVLNGPDLSLVNETLGGLDAGSLALLGPKAASERLQSALETANGVLVNAASARNYKPKGEKNNTQGVTAIDPGKIKTTSREDKIRFLQGG